MNIAINLFKCFTWSKLYICTVFLSSTGLYNYMYLFVIYSKGVCILQEVKVCVDCANSNTFNDKKRS